jgi:hypothetical protein
MRPDKPKSRHFSYLLRLWQTVDGENVVWRASLERPGSTERLGFVSLADLVAYLEQKTEEQQDRSE